VAGRNPNVLCRLVAERPQEEGWHEPYELRGSRKDLWGLRLEAHGRLWSAMTALAKLSQQSSTESCAVTNTTKRREGGDRPESKDEEGN